VDRFLYDSNGLAMAQSETNTVHDEAQYTSGCGWAVNTRLCGPNFEGPCPQRTGEEFPSPNLKMRLRINYYTLITIMNSGIYD
jgi:hypothetical protein